MDPITGKALKEVAAKAAKELAGEGLKTAAVEARQLPALETVGEAAGWPLEALRTAADVTSAAFDGLDAVLGLPEIAEEHAEEREFVGNLRKPLRIGTLGEGLAMRPDVDEVGTLWEIFFGPDEGTCTAYVHDWDPAEFDGVGEPLDAAKLWRQQQGSSSCAVVSQAGMIESMTGLHLTEEEACRIVEEGGWFDPHGGTKLYDCDKLLNHHGIETEMRQGANIVDVVEALERGDEVLVGLDATYLWYPLRDEAGRVATQPGGRGHAVWVTGVDMDQHGNVTVLMNDSGTPNGRCQAVALEDFEAGWAEMDHFVVVAKNPGRA